MSQTTAKVTRRQSRRVLGDESAKTIESLTAHVKHMNALMLDAGHHLTTLSSQVDDLRARCDSSAKTIESLTAHVKRMNALMLDAGHNRATLSSQVDDLRARCDRLTEDQHRHWWQGTPHA